MNKEMQKLQASGRDSSVVARLRPPSPRLVSRRRNPLTG